MITFETLTIPAADLGASNPMPDIKNVSYIHADYEMTPAISGKEKTHIGKGMIPTLIPYRIQDGYNRDRTPRAFRAAILENKHLRAIFLPEIGGRLWSLFDKDLGRELLYVNPVFQPANLALRNAWFSGGVEFNVGIKGHTPLTCSPLHCAVDTTPEGEVLRLYEYERIRGVVYSVSAWLPEDSRALHLRCRIENTENKEKYMYWWSNIAVPETPDTRVIVPAREAFRCFYNADHYILDKQAIPHQDGIDVSYPSNIASSRDFFYKIPEGNAKWIAAAERDGKGLLQCSTNLLKGRKLFVWGQSTGGRRWNEWLSEEGSAYVEIQAGLAHTQMEHIPMPPNTVWEWNEVYTALDCDSEALYGDYDTAVDTVEQYLRKRVGDPNVISFPEESTVTDTRFVYKGSDWGVLEEALRGKKISGTLTFPHGESEETAPWWQLLTENTFPSPDPDLEPTSYVSGKEWIERLRSLPAPSWYSLLQLGVALYAEGDLEGAKDAWTRSLSLTPSAWAYRNLAMLHKNEYGNPDKAKELLLLAHGCKPDCRALCVELAAHLTSNGEDALWLDIFETLTPAIREWGRTRLYRAIALIHLERFEEAADIINETFVMPDIKEGELSVSAVWFDLYRRLYAKRTGVAYDPNDTALLAAADKAYPLPKSLDFRMH